MRKNITINKRSLLFIFFIVVLISLDSSSFALAAAPVIFYSDLISGPNSGGQDNKGVFVTISGKNFGSSQGSSYVSVGGGQADNYPVWTDTKIAFQLGTNAVTGDIKVITSEGTSNGVPFTVRSGNIYFVDITNGNDSNVGSYNNPWKTLLKFKGQTQVGDICYAREGNYEENINFGVSDPDGDENNEICWIAYPDEVVTIIENQLGWSNITFGTQRNYYVISGFKLLSQANCIVIRGNYNRIINNDCEGLKTQAYSIINPSECNYAKIYGNKLHGARSGNKLDHPLYIGYGADNVDFGWNHIYDNDVSYGPLISINQDNAINTGVQFKGILIHDNIIDGTPPSGANRVRGLGLIAQDIGSDVKVYNNIFIECGGDIINSSYTVYQISGALELYNNTFYNSNGLYAVIITCDPLSGYYAETVNVKNNVFYVTGNSEYVSVSTNGSMGSVVLESNCYYGNDNGPIEDLSPINEDPLFLDKDNNNFRLQYGSPCIDAGYNTSAIVTTDKDGLTRPQNSVVDIGAFEYTSTTPDTTDPAGIDNLSAVSGSNNGEVNLAWTAPGDDGASGTVNSYDIRYNTQTITDVNWATTSTQISTEPAPNSAGIAESMTVIGLTAGQTYYFAIKSQDEVPNLSALSNVVSAEAKETIIIPDTTPPYTTGHSPAKSAANILPNTPIIVHVKDDGSGVDVNTIVMRVNGSIVTPTITGTPADYTLTYEPLADFNYGSTVVISVEAQDLAP